MQLPPSSSSAVCHDQPIEKGGTLTSCDARHLVPSRPTNWISTKHIQENVVHQYVLRILADESGSSVQNKVGLTGFAATTCRRTYVTQYVSMLALLASVHWQGVKRRQEVCDLMKTGLNDTGSPVATHWKHMWEKKHWPYWHRFTCCYR